MNWYGQIIGAGLHGGQPRGFLLSPLPHLLVLDEVEEGSAILGTLTSRPGDQYVVFRAMATGHAKVLAGNSYVRTDLGPNDNSPVIAATGTIDLTGFADLSLQAPPGSDRLYWQAVVEGDGSVYLSNRMETWVGVDE